MFQAVADFLWAVPAESRLINGMNELTKLGKRVTGKVKQQKMRLAEMKRAVQNSRDIDTFLQQLEQRLVAEIEDLKREMTERSDRLFLDLDASIKYQTERLADKLKSNIPIYLDGAQFVLFTSPAGNVVIPAAEAGLISYMATNGPSFVEPGTRIVISENAKPGDTVVDVGANIGLHMLTMGAAVGSTGQIIAFEPTASLARALQYTALLSGLRQARIEQCLVLDRPRKTKLYGFGHSPENSIYPTFDVNSEIRAVDAEGCSLDSYFEAGTKIDLVKIDVEGAEPLVFKGMQRVIQENPTLKIVLAMSPWHFKRAGTDLDAFYADICLAGFDVYAISEESGNLSLTTLEQVKQCEALNVLLVRRQ